MSVKIGVLCLLLAASALANSMPSPPPYPCPMVYNPVCGSDGNTYPNSMCMANKDPALAVAHVGRCGDVPSPLFDLE